MRRLGGTIVIAAGMLISRPDLSSFPPSLELSTAHAQKKSSNAEIAAWIREGGSKALTDEDEGVRMNAAWKLRYAVEDGADISGAAGDLVSALADRNEHTKGYAAFALEMIYLRKKDWPKAAALLNHDDNDVRTNASWAVGSAAEKRSDLSAFLPSLQKALSNDNEFVRWNASKAIVLHHLGKNAGKKAETLLKSDNEDVRQGAEEAVRIYKPR
ncbi:MAG: HEAT repeat domain-containing protein [Candidatus Micrarchaeia archaeon]